MDGAELFDMSSLSPRVYCFIEQQDSVSRVLLWGGPLRELGATRSVEGLEFNSNGARTSRCMATFEPRTICALFRALGASQSDDVVIEYSKQPLMVQGYPYWSPTAWFQFIEAMGFPVLNDSERWKVKAPLSAICETSWPFYFSPFDVQIQISTTQGPISIQGLGKDSQNLEVHTPYRAIELRGRLHRWAEVLGIEFRLVEDENTIESKPWLHWSASEPLR